MRLMAATAAAALTMGIVPILAAPVVGANPCDPIAIQMGASLCSSCLQAQARGISVACYSSAPAVSPPAASAACAGLTGNALVTCNACQLGSQAACAAMGNGGPANAPAPAAPESTDRKNH